MWDGRWTGHKIVYTNHNLPIRENSQGKSINIFQILSNGTYSDTYSMSYKERTGSKNQILVDFDRFKVTFLEWYGIF